MRTFKFRALEDGKMLHQVLLSNYGAARFLGFISETAILMQSTGLTDKNGKEIYEGDIRREEIELETGDERLYFVCTWIKELTMFAWLTPEEYLEYTDKDPQEFDIIFEDENPYSLDATETQYYIVCGNVYENPELLNG